MTENRVATPEFFQVTKQQLVAGRLLGPQDDGRQESPTVVVVNQALVRRDFAGKDPIGKRFYTTSDTTFATIVGVVSDIRNFGPIEDPRPEVYRAVSPGGSGVVEFPHHGSRATREPGGPDAGQVRAAVRSVDQQVAITDVQDDAGSHGTQHGTSAILLDPAVGVRGVSRWCSPCPGSTEC